MTTSPSRLVAILFCTLWAVVASPLATADDDPWRSQRTLFLQAEQAFRRGDLTGYRSLAAQLTTYPLYPYLLYKRLSSGIGPASYGEIEDFIEQYRDSPLAEQLRGLWLDDLAGRGFWPRYLEAYQPSGNISRQCHYHYAQWLTGDRVAALAGARTLWIHGASQPKACDALFEVWLASDAFHPDDAEARTQLAMAAGEWQLVRYLKRFLPPPQQDSAEQWIRLYHNPSLLRECSQREELLRSATPQAIAHGLQRLAANDPPAALTAFREIDPRVSFTESQRLAVTSAIVSRYAYRDLPGTNVLLHETPAAMLDESTREARMRWAVRVGQLHHLPAWYYDLSETDRESTRWRYWRAHAWEAQDNVREAELAFRELARERDYYGFLSADRVGLPYSFKHRPLEPIPELLAALRATGFVTRAKELRHLDRITAANREWWHGLRAADDATMDAAIVLASELGWHRVAVLTASQARRWDDVGRRFPVAYDEAISSAATARGLPREILMSLARRESAFDPFARSGAGARGLLQIMPATGRQIANELGEAWRSTWDLYDSERSLRYGSYYLAEQLKRFEGQLPLALAAYNGGPHNVTRWLRFDGTLPAERWIETIGFKETREYVQAILAYAVIYRSHLNLPVQRMSRDLKPVTGLGAVRTEASNPRSCKG